MDGEVATEDQLKKIKKSTYIKKKGWLIVILKVCDFECFMMQSEKRFKNF